jgi:hypothetical protein
MGQWKFLSSFWSMPKAAISDPPGHPVLGIEKFKPPAFLLKIYRSTSKDVNCQRVEIRGETHAAGRDSEDQDIAEFEFEKFQS